MPGRLTWRRSDSLAKTSRLATSRSQGTLSFTPCWHRRTETKVNSTNPTDWISPASPIVTSRLDRAFTFALARPSLGWKARSRYERYCSAQTVFVSPYLRTRFAGEKVWCYEASPGCRRHSNGGFEMAGAP